MTLLPLRALLLGGFLLLTITARAQTEPPPTPPGDSIVGRTPVTASPSADTLSGLDKILDVFEFEINRNAVARRPGTYPTKLVLAPILSYSPETSWSAGVGAKFLFKLPKSGPETRTSNLPISAQYTLNNQLILYSGYTIFFNQEQYLLKGNLEYSSFPRLFYGIGNHTPASNEEVYSYRFFLFEPLLLKRVVGKLFVGGGVRYTSVSNVELEEGSQLADGQVAGALGARSTGLETAITYDTRDNVLNAYHGTLAEITHGWYDKRFGGTQQYELTKVDVRRYWKLFHHRDDVLAVHGYGYFATGTPPLLELGALGGTDLLRGYYEGRHLDRNFVAGQIEYRRPLTKRFGVVGFAAAGRVADRFSNLSFSGLKPAVGAGLRFKIVKAENLNLRFDYGIGPGTNNFYFNVAEAF
jgi:outer membrane protein assembly factor BamA